MMRDRDTESKTPRILTARLVDICDSHNLHDLVFVPRVPKNDCEAGNCFSNVQKYVEKYGGNLLMGWNVTVRKNLYVECEAHAVWENPEKQVIDITPINGDGNQTLFSCVKGMLVQKTPSKYLPLTDSELLLKYIDLRNQFEIIRCTSGDEMQVPQSLMYGIVGLDEIFIQKTGRNEPCTCGSGLKHKRCCGRDY
jgi:hypothetical protein